VGGGAGFGVGGGAGIGVGSGASFGVGEGVAKKKKKKKKKGAYESSPSFESTSASVFLPFIHQ
jgi:hypothetical protein